MLNEPPANTQTHSWTSVRPSGGLRREPDPRAGYWVGSVLTGALQGGVKPSGLREKLQKLVLNVSLLKINLDAF